jgi:DHA2 family multidrug resistance protein
VGIAVLSTYMTRSMLRHRQLLANHIDAFDRGARGTVERLTEAWTLHGADPTEALGRARASVAALVAQQAQLLAFLDAFRLLAAIFLLMMPLVLVLRRPRASPRIDA